MLFSDPVAVRLCGRSLQSFCRACRLVFGSRTGLHGRGVTVTPHGRGVTVTTCVLQNRPPTPKVPLPSPIGRRHRRLGLVCRTRWQSGRVVSQQGLHTRSAAVGSLRLHGAWGMHWCRQFRNFGSDSFPHVVGGRAAARAAPPPAKVCRQDRCPCRLAW